MGVAGLLSQVEYESMNECLFGTRTMIYTVIILESRSMGKNEICLPVVRLIILINEWCRFLLG